ncbi:MAG: PIN domain-containing protein [Egibacteraceae bacterium]
MRTSSSVITGDGPDQAARATRFLAKVEELLLVDLVVAETVSALESFSEVKRTEVATLLRAVLPFPRSSCTMQACSIGHWRSTRSIGSVFVEAYLIASAETSGVSAVASFDRAIDRVPTVHRIEPG